MTSHSSEGTFNNITIWFEDRRGLAFPNRHETAVFATGIRAISVPPRQARWPVPKAVSDPKALVLAKRLYADGPTDVATICRTLGISRATLYRALKGNVKSTD